MKNVEGFTGSPIKKIERFDTTTVTKWLHMVDAKRGVPPIQENGKPGFTVVFHSLLKEGADTKALAEQDKSIIEEAEASGGLIDYLGGERNKWGVAVNRCHWSDEESARTATQKPEHSKGMKLGIANYADHQVYRFDVFKSKETPGGVLYVPKNPRS